MFDSYESISYLTIGHSLLSSSGNLKECIPVSFKKPMMSVLNVAGAVTIVVLEEHKILKVPSSVNELKPMTSASIL